MNTESQQVLNLIVAPTLKLIGMDSLSAQLLITYTGAVESEFDALKQSPKGPAIGWWQMEPIAFKQNVMYVSRYPDIKKRILAACLTDIMPPYETMIWNLRFACCMARIQYWQHQEPLPKPDDLEGMGRYYIKYYNCGGAATLDRFVEICQGLVKY